MKKIYSEVDPYGRRNGLPKAKRPVPRKQGTRKGAVLAALKEVGR